jgi:hypothetical protein
MAFVHGKSGKVMVNAAHLSADVRGWTASWKRDMADTTALQDNGMRCTPGLMEGTVNLDAHFDSTTGRLIQVITDAANDGVAGVGGVDNGLLVSILPEGDTLGAPAFFAATDLESFEVESEVDDRVQVSLEAAADTTVDFGVSLHALGAETADTDHTSVDQVAATTNGGAAILHVTSVSASDSVVVKVQHSVDDSVWADLLTFTSASAAGSERVETAQGVTVNRYVRASTDVTGSSVSISYQMNFARR